MTLKLIKDLYLTGRFKSLNPVGVSALLFTCANLNFYDQDLIEKAISTLRIDQPFSLPSLKSNLWAMAKLNIYDEPLFVKFNEILEKYHDKMSEADLVLVFDSYAELSYKMPKQTLSLLLRQVAEQVEKFDLNSLAALQTALVKLEIED